MLVGGGLPNSKELLGSISENISTPLLAIIGKWDTVVSTESSMMLADKFLNKETTFHGGAHIVPLGSITKKQIKSFLKSLGLESNVPLFNLPPSSALISLGQYKPLSLKQSLI
ncbi:hypothetical protein AYI68_g3669 [Smittium mucronatum]|uniref:Serine hydrolase domain-containing protein n=1 Tax=Smittium mucronatum TaxID=133383 RepID=A0A1R0GZA3_9FUNG|nr:hypothetical protein AYI68_g3669 [Smittium mucronatum]